MRPTPVVEKPPGMLASNGDKSGLIIYFFIYKLVLSGFSGVEVSVNAAVLLGSEKQWCPGGDLNSHDLTATST